MEDSAIVIALKLRDDAQAPMKQALNGIQGDLRQTSLAAVDFRMKWVSLASAIGTGLIGYGIIRELKDFAAGVIDAGAQAERLRSSFKAIFGDSQKASAEITFLKQTAHDLGAEYLTLTDAYKGISAAAKGTSLEGQGVRDIFYSIAEAGTVLNLSSETVQGALLAISQMISKGTVQAEELRGQLGERLPGTFQIAARAMGMTTAELDKFMQNGKLLPSDLVPKMAKALHEQNKGSLSEALNNTTAATNRLSNAFRQLREDLAEGSGISSGWKWFKNQLADTLTYLDTYPQRLRNFRDTFKNTFTINGMQIPGLWNMPNIYDSLRASSNAFERNPNQGKTPAVYTGEILFGAETARQQAGLSSDKQLQMTKDMETEARKIHEDTMSSLDQYTQKVTKLQTLYGAGKMALDDYQKAVVLAREEYEKGAPVKKIEQELSMSKSASDIKLDLLEREKDQTDYAYQQGKISLTQYYADTNRIVLQSVNERIGMLEQERRRSAEILQLELQSPSKSPLEKDILQRQFQSRSAQIDADISSQRTQYLRFQQQFQETYSADVRKRVDAEVQAFSNVANASTLSFSQRIQAGEAYLQKRIMQIDLEAEEMRKKGVSSDTVAGWRNTEIAEAQRQVAASNAAQLTQLAQLNVSYVELTGNVEQQLRAQIELIQAQKDQKLKEVGGEVTELGKAYQMLYEKQAKLLDLRLNGSFGQGMEEGIRQWRNSLPTAAEEGMNAMRLLTGEINNTADALTDFTMTGKAEVSDFANSVIKDFLRMYYTQQLNQGLNRIFGAFGIGNNSPSSFTMPTTPNYDNFMNTDFSNIFGNLPGKASGGPVDANRLYWTGERGPELFMPKTAGTIIPNNKIGGQSNTYIIKVDVTPPVDASGRVDSSGAKKYGTVMGDAIKARLNEWGEDNMRSGGMFNPGLSND